MSYVFCWAGNWTIYRTSAGAITLLTNWNLNIAPTFNLIVCVVLNFDEVNRMSSSLSYIIVRRNNLSDVLSWQSCVFSQSGWECRINGPECKCKIWSFHIKRSMSNLFVIPDSRWSVDHSSGHIYGLWYNSHNATELAGMRLETEQNITPHLHVIRKMGSHLPPYGFNPL